MVGSLMRPKKSSGRTTSQVVVLSRDEEVSRLTSNKTHFAIFFFNVLTSHVSMAWPVFQNGTLLGFCHEDIHIQNFDRFVIS